MMKCLVGNTAGLYSVMLVCAFGSSAMACDACHSAAVLGTTITCPATVHSAHVSVEASAVAVQCAPIVVPAQAVAIQAAPIVVQQQPVVVQKRVLVRQKAIAIHGHAARVRAARVSPVGSFFAAIRANRVARLANLGLIH